MNQEIEKIKEENKHEIEKVKPDLLVAQEAEAAIKKDKEEGFKIVEKLKQEKEMAL